MTHINWDWRLLQSRMDVSNAIVSLADADRKLELPNGTCSIVLDLIDDSGGRNLNLIEDIMKKLDDLSWTSLVDVDDIPTTPAETE
jgi:hypothetical protein